MPPPSLRHLHPGAIRERIVAGTLLMLLASVAISLPVGLARLGVGPLSLLPLPYLALYLVCLWLVRRRRTPLATALFVAVTVSTLPLLVLATGGLRGTAAPYVPVSVTLAVVWLEPWPAALAVLGHLGAIGLVYLLDPPTALVLPAEVIERGRPNAWPIAFFIIAGVSHQMLAALRQAEADARAHAAESEQAHARQLAAARTKTRFLATMSHELRTPLNAILGYTELLHEDAGAGPSGPDLERIGRAGRQLLTLVEDLLELARAESSGTRDLQAVDLRALLSSVGLAPPGAPATVRADPDALGRLLQSLRAHHPRLATDAIERAEGEVVLRFVGANPPGSGVEVVLAERLAHTLGTRLRHVGDRLTLQLPERDP